MWMVWESETVCVCVCTCVCVYARAYVCIHFMNMQQLPCWHSFMWSMILGLLRSHYIYNCTEVFMIVTVLKFKVHAVIFMSWSCGEFNDSLYVDIKDTLQSHGKLENKTFDFSVCSVTVEFKTSNWWGGRGGGRSFQCTSLLCGALVESFSRWCLTGCNRHSFKPNRLATLKRILSSSLF